MVEVSYRREMNHNYMIIHSPDREMGGYEARMLAGNCIEGLLKFRIRPGEEKREFYYEITSKQPLKRLLDCRMIAGSEIRKLLLRISATLSAIEEYLLKEEQILLDPEYIYVEPDSFSVFLCMVPGYSCDFPAAFTELLQYLLEKVNHQDKDGVVLAYNLYHESLKENYGMQDLLKHLTKNTGGIFEEKGKENLGLDVRREALSEDKALKADEEDETEIYYERKSQKEWNGTKREATEQKRKERGGFTKKDNVFLYILTELMKILLLSAAGLLALWFLAGEYGIRRYGVFIGAGIVLLFLCKNILMKAPEKNTQPIENNLANRKRKSGNSNDVGYRPTEWEEMPDKESWRVTFEDDDDTELSRSTETERDPKMETELLADLDATEQLAVMESLSKERGNIEISYIPFVIGKHPEMADYCLRQSTVSRLHLRIDKKEGVYIVTDLNSTNGTTVEGYHLQANETVSIKNNDIIYLADAGYRFMERN